ncbi:MAG: hypothetical protein EXR79_04340 [Myxococcales bacterium]|nr:hypothetical protein [Myxococcales bacterium]
MPVLTLRTLPLPADVPPPRVLAALVAAVAPCLGVDAARVFAVHQPLAPGSFVQGSSAAALQPAGTHPPLLDIAAYAGRSDAQIRAALEAAAAVLCAELRLEPGNAFVTYTEIGRGRVFTGGSVRFG